jgi:hypothetical protein
VYRILSPQSERCRPAAQIDAMHAGELLSASLCAWSFPDGRRDSRSCTLRLTPNKKESA